MSILSQVKQQFIRNTFSGWFAQFSAAIVGFIMLPYNISHLGKDVYGISVVAVSAIALLQFLSLGMRPALLRFFSQTIAKKDREEMIVLSSTSQLLLGGLGLAGCLIILAGTPWFIRFYEIDPDHHLETQCLLFCMGITFFLQFHSIVFTNIVFASNRYDLVNLRSVFSSWLRLGALFFLYSFFTPSLTLLGIALLFGGAYNYLTLFWFCFREHGRRVAFFSPKKVALSRLPSVFAFSGYTMLNSIFFTASIQIPVMIIGKTLGKEMATAFAPAVLIATYLASVLGQIASPLTPLASRDTVKTGGKNIARWAIHMGQLVACVGYGCIFMAIFFIPDVLRLWLGNDFVWTSSAVVVLISGIVYASIQAVNYNLALGASSIAPIAYSSVVMAILTSFGTLLGTMYWNWSLLEVALCITIVRILRNTFFLSWIYSKLFSYDYSDYFIKVYVKPVLPGLLTYLLVLVLRQFVFPISAGFVVLGMEIACIAFVYVIFTWYFGLGKEIKAAIFMVKKKHVAPSSSFE